MEIKKTIRGLAVEEMRDGYWYHKLYIGYTRQQIKNLEK